MILSDRELRAAVARGALAVSPDPPADAWSSTALDLRLAKELVVWRAGSSEPISPSAPDYDFDAIRRLHGDAFLIPDDGFVFQPNTFLLGWTIERIQLPHRSRLAARVEGKSSLARLGIGVHVTAPTIHAGFGFKSHDESYPGSPIQLEMWNTGPLNIKLEQGMRICQIIFELVDGTPDRGYEGRFSIQGPDVPT